MLATSPFVGRGALEPFSFSMGRGRGLGTGCLEPLGGRAGGSGQCLEPTRGGVRRLEHLGAGEGGWIDASSPRGLVGSGQGALSPRGLLEAR